jgi:hypothetical protein
MLRLNLWALTQVDPQIQGQNLVWSEIKCLICQTRTQVDPRHQRGENEGGSIGDLPRHTTVTSGGRYFNYPGK